jgi:ectoine hydroxylase-related dioxygenase (phytanoyl-CoA dioxygenase family)
MLSLIPKSHVDYHDYDFPKKELPGDFTSTSEIIWEIPSHLSRGDIILFHYKTIHFANPNLIKKKYRLSIDTRYLSSQTVEK